MDIISDETILFFCISLLPFLGSPLILFLKSEPKRCVFHRKKHEFILFSYEKLMKTRMPASQYKIIIGKESVGALIRAGKGVFRINTVIQTS